MTTLSLTGCPPPGEAPDAGPEPDGGSPWTLTVGTGQDDFTPFEDGDTLTLVRGAQGAQHVWIALRAEGLDPHSPMVELWLTRDDGTEVSFPYRVRVSMTGDESIAELTGLALVVPDPDPALDTDLTLTASVTDRDGRQALSTRRIRVSW